MDRLYILKTCLLILICFQPLTTPIQAISPETPKEAAYATFIAFAGMLPIEIAYLNSQYERTTFSKEIKNPKLWVGFTIAGAAFSSLLYYVLKKYTPEAKFNWALNVKEQAENSKVILCKNLNKQDATALFTDLAKSIKIPEPKSIFMQSVNRLYILHNNLERAYSCLLEARQDMPNDVIFKHKCDILAEKIKNLKETVLSCVLHIVYSNQWVNEIVGNDYNSKITAPWTFIPLDLMESLLWSANLRNIIIAKTGFGNYAEYHCKSSMMNSTVDWDDYQESKVISSII